MVTIFFSCRAATADWTSGLSESTCLSWIEKREPVRLTTGPITYGSIAISSDEKKIFTRGVEVRGELQRYDPKSRHFHPFLRGLSADCCVYSNDGKMDSVRHISGRKPMEEQVGWQPTSATHMGADERLESVLVAGRKGDRFFSAPAGKNLENFHYSGGWGRAPSAHPKRLL